MRSQQVREAPAKMELTGSLAGPALRTFFRIAEEWKLSTPEQQSILNVHGSTFFSYRKRPPASLSNDVLERISYVFGMYKALEVLLPAADRVRQWLRTTNAAPVFSGQSPIERMTAGQVADLFLVRQYLDAARGWGG